MTAKTKPVTLGDLIIAESAPPSVTRESKTVTNSTGSEITLEVGYPMDDNVPVTSGSEANTDGLLLEHCVLENGASKKLPVLARGPSAINGDALPAADYAGSSFTLATVKSTVEALGIQVKEEPDEQSTQES